MKRNGILAVLLLVLVAACRNPTLEVDTDPPGTVIHVDGRPTGRSPLTTEPRYYGTVLVEAELATDLEHLDRSPSPVQRKVPMDPPVTRWVFPLDLVGEAVVRVFGDLDERVELRLEPPAEREVRVPEAIDECERASRWR
ncbi:MAG: hypothetical protein R3F30_08930 [Planctomycetota bacterium]